MGTRETGAAGRSGDPPWPWESRESGGARPSRRTFLCQAALLAAAAALVEPPDLLVRRDWLAVAPAAAADLVHDTLSGLVAFVVPGPDAYSVAQGASTTEPGGIAAGATDALVATLDGLQPAPPLSAVVAAILNQVAEAVHPNAPGPFVSPFARLVFPEKAVVFKVLESPPQPGAPDLRPLAGVLPGLVAFLSYSEVGVFDPRTRTLTGQPVGWAISGYEGVADGRDEFKGYFQNRQRVDG